MPFSREPDFFSKNPENFQSRAFRNILFLVPTQYQHSGLGSSQLVSGRETFRNSRTLPKWKINNFNFALVKTFLTGTDLLIEFSTCQYFPDESRFSVPTKKSPEWYCLIRFNGKSLKIRYSSRLSWVVKSSPVSSGLFPGFSRATGPLKSSLVLDLPIRELASSLFLSCLF